MRTLIAILVLIVAALPAAAKEQLLAADGDGRVAFTMPSGNIGCVYSPNGGTAQAAGGPQISCDRREPSPVNITLGRSAPAMLTEYPAAQPCCGSATVLAYGNTTRLGGFICSSSRAGLVCETPDGKHGLCLSRTRTLHY